MRQRAAPDITGSKPDRQKRVVMRNLPDFSIPGVRTSPKNCGFPIMFPGRVPLADTDAATNPQRHPQAGVLSATEGLSGGAGRVKVWQVLRIILSTSSAILSNTRTYPKREDSSGVRNHKCLAGGPGAGWELQVPSSSSARNSAEEVSKE
jgi:hypothetical protein